MSLVTEAARAGPPPTKPTAAIGVLTLFVPLYIAFLYGLLVVHALFTYRSDFGDDLGLYNAIYMFQHFGDVTYPMQGQYESMTVHPPLHYFVVGLFAKSGFSVLHAAGMPLALLGAVSLAVVARSRMSGTAKIAVSSGFALAVLVYSPRAAVRPELHIVFAWFCGLVLLEAARLDDWDSRKLLAGSFFTAYASGLHYWAGAAALALPIFLGFLLVTRGVRMAARKAVPMAAGALLFYVPYCVFFVIPDFQQIATMLRATDATGGGVAASMATHLALFDESVMLYSWGSYARIGGALHLPIKQLGLSPILVTIPILLASRSLRGMALAGAALPLFVLAMVSRKAGLYYLSPELVLYLVALVWAVLAAGDFVWRHSVGRVPRVPRVLLCVPHILLSVALGVILLQVAAWTRPGVGLSWHQDDWEVSRAANRSLLGDDALVGVNQVTMWYISGASRLLWFTEWGLDWPKLQELRVDRFDSLVILDDWFANQQKALPWPSFYLDGQLQLRGFYFYEKHDPRTCGLGIMNHLHLTARSGEVRSGHAYDRHARRLFRYVEDPNGPSVLVVLMGLLPAGGCPAVDYSAVLGVDPITSDEPRIYALLMDRPIFEAEQARYAERAMIRDVIPLAASEVSVTDVLRNSHDKPIVFLRTPADLR